MVAVFSYMEELDLADLDTPAFSLKLVYIVSDIDRERKCMRALTQRPILSRQRGLECSFQADRATVPLGKRIRAQRRKLNR